MDIRAVECLARNYETKKQIFEMHQLQNTAGKTPEEQRNMAIKYHVVEAQMMEAYRLLQREKETP